jgi:hypothetical protein
MKSVRTKADATALSKTIHKTNEVFGLNQKFKKLYRIQLMWICLVITAMG